MQLGTRAVQVTDDGGHAGLVTEHGGKVDGLLGVILGEAVRVLCQCLLPVFMYPSPSSPTFPPHVQRPMRFFSSRMVCAIVPLHLSAVTGAALPGKEGQRTVAGRLELPVRHLCCGLVEN